MSELSESSSSWRLVFAEDLAAHGIDRWTWRLRVTRPEVHYQRLLRRTESGGRSGPVARARGAVAKFRLLRLGSRLGLMIPPHVFGPGLAIAHYGSVIVNAGSQVGRNCRIHAGTTIGSTRSGAPTIGNDVYIGPGAVISGPVTVGDGAAIGANAVVIVDVPPGVTVGGVPAKVISQSGSERIHPNVHLGT